MKNSTAIINVACAIVFLVFVFCYVYFFQADILVYGQYVLSGGMRHLNPIIWASIITIILWIIQLFIRAFIKLPSRVRSLTYFPSLIILGTLTSIEPDSTGSMNVGNWWWISIFLLIIYGFSLRILVQFTSLEGDVKNRSILSGAAWNNFIILLLMMLMTLGMGNTDELVHIRLKAERFIDSRQFDKAAAVGKEFTEVDSTLTMFRILALSETKHLGEELFSYPLTGGSRAMIPQRDGSVGMSFADSQILWRHLGGIPLVWDGDTKAFLKRLIAQGKAKPCVEDYLLTAYLLDRDINGFAKEIKKYYDFRSPEELEAAEEKLEKRRKKLERAYGDTIPADSLREVMYSPLHIPLKDKAALPRFYRQALVLYMKTCPNPCLQYSDEILDADYDDFIKLCHTGYNSTAAHQYAIKKSYSDTYWLYYKLRN